MARSTRRKRTYREIFVDKLKQLSGGEQRLIANNVLRTALDWDEEKYTSIKAQLKDENKVIVSRGRGGMVGLASAAGEQSESALTGFVIYSHADENLKSALMKHLEPLRRQGLIDVWHDRKIKAGEEWERAISKYLQKADVILVLVRVDFINSSYCYDIEMESALERHASQKARLIPVILRNCLWENTPLRKLQALPKDGRAVKTWSDVDEALTSVAEGIRTVAEELQTSIE